MGNSVEVAGTASVENFAFSDQARAQVAVMPVSQNTIKTILIQIRIRFDDDGV